VLVPVTVSGDTLLTRGQTVVNVRSGGERKFPGKEPRMPVPTNPHRIVLV